MGCRKQSVLRRCYSSRFFLIYIIGLSNKLIPKEGTWKRRNKIEMQNDPETDQAQAAEIAFVKEHLPYFIIYLAMRIEISGVLRVKVPSTQ